MPFSGVPGSAAPSRSAAVLTVLLPSPSGSAQPYRNRVYLAEQGVDQRKSLYCIGRLFFNVAPKEVLADLMGLSRATLDRTEITPLPPIARSGTIWSSRCPEYRSTHPFARCMISAIAEKLPLASFTPTMFEPHGRAFTMVSGFMVRPVRVGTWYNRHGILTDSPNCGIMRNQAILGCLVVIRSYQQQSVCSGLSASLERWIASLRAVGTGTRNDRNPLVYYLAGETDHIQMLLVTHGSGLASGAACDDRVGAPLLQSAPLTAVPQVSRNLPLQIL